MHQGLCFKLEPSFPKVSKKSHHMTWRRACRSTEEAGISVTEHELSGRTCRFPSFPITAFVCCRLKLPLLVPRTPHPKHHPPTHPPSPYAMHRAKSGKADRLPASKHRFPAPLSLWWVINAAIKHWVSPGRHGGGITSSHACALQPREVDAPRLPPPAPCPSSPPAPRG